MTLKSIQEYGKGFQIKVLSSLLTHKEFLANIYDILNEEDFNNQAHRWVVKEIIKYYDKYHTTPSLDILKVEVKKVENEVLQLSIKEQLREAYIASDEDLKYVQEEFSTFCKNQALKKALLSSVDLLKAGDYDSIKLLVENAMKAGADKNIGHEYNLDIETRYREDNRSPVATPWPKINDLLQGGLGQGDFGLVFGNPGGGKSWCLVALGGHAIRMGYNVLHYTLELGEDYVGRRYDSFFTKVPVNKIMLEKERVEEVIPQLPGKLVIKEFPTGKASIHTVESHIRKCIDQDVKPDLVLIDYVDLLSSRKKEDKVNGTGRFHIMKNRYGMDGLTYRVNVNTTIGKIEIGDVYDEEADTVVPGSSSYENFDNLDRKMLKSKFFELNS